MHTLKNNLSFVLLVACCLSLAKPLLAIGSETLNIRFAYVGPESHSSLVGVKQGIAEANLQGQFLDQTYDLDTIPVEAIGKTDFSAYIAVISAVEYAVFVKLSESLPHMPIFNTILGDDSLRTMCLPNALHIIPSDRMRADAVKQWLQKDALAQVIAQAWHEDFVKFAARDLNKRFKKNFHQTMDDYAWAGWAAVKMTSDSVARERIDDAKDILRYLQTNLVFDGQKGSNMNFRQTGQLRQLMLLIEGNKIVAEAPVRGIAKPPTLDSLGLLGCEK